MARITTTGAGSPEERREFARDLGGRLPEGFELGVTTSAFQIEGATHEGGRGESVWDAFSQEPGRILDGSTADRAADHFHRMPEDVALMRDLGIDGYRFSFSWPRLQAEGRGALRSSGTDFYERLLDQLDAAGIRPFATLFHWDTPAALRGGWFSRDTALRFGDYAFALGERFGDRIDRWATLEEPATVTFSGHAVGVHAPGATRLFNALPVAHHQLLGHGLAVQALRGAGVTGGIGIVGSHSPVVASTGSEADTAFAELYDMLQNRVYADAVLLGRYPQPPEGFEALFTALAEAEPADLALIGQPLDFYGLNYRAPTKIGAGSGEGTGWTPDGTSAAMASLPFRFGDWPEYPASGSGEPIAPEFLGIAIRELAERYGEALPAVVVTASGVSFPDAVELEEGTGTRRVHDGLRIDYLARHLDEAVGAAASAGVDLRGFFVRSLLDDFGWQAGLTRRTGIVHVDFDEFHRTPKDSFAWLALLAESR